MADSPAFSGNVNSLFTPPTPSSAPTTDVTKDGMAAALGTFDDEELLELWQKIRRESIDTRLVFQRQWHRNILYTLGRQWIEYHANAQGWKDKRLAAWTPRPVTNKCKETVQAIRAIFTAVQLGVNVRPNGTDPKNVAAASTADDLAPLIHEVHHMNDVLMEFDFWLLVCGNAFLQEFVDYDMKYGLVSDPSLTCPACTGEFKTSEIANAGNKCPECATSTGFTPALDEGGSPILNQKPKGQPSTITLSPLELAFSNSYHRWDDLPYVVRLRWRTKAYYEGHPQLKDLVPNISWEKGSGDLSLQLFRALTQHNDLGLAPQYLMGSELSGSDREDGITEYEVWYKPCDAYPDGLVFRVVGDKEGGRILHLEDTESLPGPLPYQDADGHPLFPFQHAAYEHVGGRILGSGPIDVMIQKQDQLNQADSHILLQLTRMANPVWLWPKGSDPGKMNGMPGLIVTWDPLTVGGNAKPERIAGTPIDASVMAYREQILSDIEELTGTFDIMKGAKPTGVEAFSALQLLDERSKGRFTPVFQARGDAYKDWFKCAIELERQFGPDERTKAVMSSARTWTFQNFKRASLQGSMSVVVENGSTVPKTNLGMRAAMDHAKQMGMIDFNDPGVKYAGLQLMGLTKLVPSLDINIQAALQKQQAFEDWAADPGAMKQSFIQQQQAVQQQQQQFQAQLQQHLTALDTIPLGPSAVTGEAAPLPPTPQPPPPPSILTFTPLKWKGWYNAPVHLQEFLNWANSDSVRELLATNAQLEPLLEQHLQEIQANMPPAKSEPAKVQWTFNGQDLADPQLRQLFDRSEGLPPGTPSMTPQQRPAKVSIAEKVPEPEPQGAGRAMMNSNNNSAPVHG